MFPYSISSSTLRIFLNTLYCYEKGLIEDLIVNHLPFVFHPVQRCIMQMFLLAGPGVLISTFCLGAALKV